MNSLYWPTWPLTAVVCLATMPPIGGRASWLLREALCALWRWLPGGGRRSRVATQTTLMAVGAGAEGRGLPSHVLGADYPPIQTASNGVELTEVRSGTPRGEGRPLDRRRDHRDRRDGSDERIAAERRDRREEPRRHGGAHVPARRGDEDGDRDAGDEAVVASSLS
jgi:hypothetical protein